MLPENRINYLLEAWIKRTSTEAEEQELFNWLVDTNDTSALKTKVQQMLLQDHPNVETSNVDWSQLYHEALSQAKKAESLKAIVRRFPWTRIAAAAVILIFLSLGAYWIYHKNYSSELVFKDLEKPKDIKPPSINKTTITLADGTRITLDSFQNGSLAKQGNVLINKTSKGEVAYTINAGQPAQSLVWNTLTVPRGSQIVSLTLADGSKVWLNSESSLHYPVAFTGDERLVEITGEAYFEVAKDAHKKFIVSGSGIKTEVLGTHFNVNTYADEEAAKVSLLEGSVKVGLANDSHLSAIIKPGQQAAFAPNAKVIVHDAIDAEEVIAWKNNLFFYDGADLHAVMRQVARWYNVDIKYEGNIPAKSIAGQISRNVNISQLLKMIELTGGVHFTIEGNTIIAKP